MSHHRMRPSWRDNARKPPRNAVVVPPAGWLWTLPFTIHRGYAPGNFHVGGWDVSSLAPSGGTDIYVSLAGNDTTGDGSSGNPYRSVKKASTVVVAGSTIHVAPGIYSYVSSGVWSGWDGYGPAGKTYSVKRWGASGDVVFSMHQALTYALDPGLTFAYKGTLLSGTITRVFDAKTPDANGDYAELALVANAATVDTTPASWYTDGASLWVRLSDDRAPDSDVRPYTAADNGVIQRGSTVYVENCRFEGGTNAMSITSAGAGLAPATGYFKDCTFRYAVTEGLRALAGTIIAQNCTASRAKNDDYKGDEYQSNDPSGWSPAYVALIHCRALYAGDGGAADNSGSLHGGAAVVTPGHWLSINGDYSHADGPECSHIELARAWHLGDHVHDTDPASSVNYRMSAGTMWLDTCWSEDATYDITLLGNAVCYKHNCIDAGAYSVEAGSTLASY